MVRSVALPLLLVVIPQTASALEVSPGSPCATLCLDSPSGNEWNASASNTYTEDITCHDDGYYSTSKGQKFRKCLDCLQTSSRGHEGETDLEWFIYNLRYTVSTCVFSKPKPAIEGNHDAPCNTDATCGPFNDPLTSDGPSPNVTATWDYCAANDGEFLGSQLQPCISCLRDSKNQTYLANFMTALEAGCMQSPDNVTTLGLSGSLFTTTPINITDPNASPDSSHGHPHHHLSLAAIIGIVVAIVLIFALAICLFVIHCTRQNAASNPENAYYYGEDPDSPKTLVDPWGYVMSQPKRFIGFHDKKGSGGGGAPVLEGRADETNAEYYNRVEKEEAAAAAPQPGRIQTQHAHIPNRRQGEIPRMPSPIAPVRKQRPQTPDSFIEQAYLNTVEDASRLTRLDPTHHHTRPRQQSTSSPTSVSPTTTIRTSWSSRIPSVIPKIRMSKKYTPPMLQLQPTSPGEAPGERQLRISPPIMQYDARFDERSPPGTETAQFEKDKVSPRRGSRASKGSKKHDSYIEVPIRNSENDLY
ncbi:hypothetical protein PT974_06766 [Cladobotryum mycophilum]|uniref:Uncharacterized protein n=1 Tax=Cladobotryum mycophilum TaxID=491253 RepID=A0ABR0SMF0_9HYPO